jgi:hypothetical protein
MVEFMRCPFTSREALMPVGVNFKAAFIDLFHGILPDGNSHFLAYAKFLK